MLVVMVLINMLTSSKTENIKEIISFYCFITITFLICGNNLVMLVMLLFFIILNKLIISIRLFIDIILPDSEQYFIHPSLLFITFL